MDRISLCDVTIKFDSEVIFKIPTFGDVAEVQSNVYPLPTHCVDSHKVIAIWEDKFITAE